MKGEQNLILRTACEAYLHMDDSLNELIDDSTKEERKTYQVLASEGLRVPGHPPPFQNEIVQLIGFFVILSSRSTRGRRRTDYVRRGVGTDRPVAVHRFPSITLSGFVREATAKP